MTQETASFSGGEDLARPDLWQLLEDNIDGIAVFDQDARYLFLNREAEQILSKPRVELIGKTVRETFPESVTESALFRQHFEQALHQQVAGSYESFSPAISRWLSLRLVPCRLQRNGIDESGVATYFRDITDQKRAEEQLAALVEQQRAFLKDVLFAVTEEVLRLCDSERDLPSPAPVEGNAIPLTDATALHQVRRAAESAAIYCYLSQEQRNDLLTAASEAAMNVLAHASGQGTSHIVADPARGMVQVWITDSGQGMSLEQLHRAVLERGFTTTKSLGHGFWLILRTADVVYLYTIAGQGTTVVIEKRRARPLPAWIDVSLFPLPADES